MENPLKEIVRNATFLTVIQGILFIVLGVIIFIHPQVLVALAAAALAAAYDGQGRRGVLGRRLA